MQTIYIYVYIFLFVYICVCKVQAKVDKEHMNKVEAIAYRNLLLKWWGKGQVLHVKGAFM